MARQIDTKYLTTGAICRLDGTPLPEDEPLMLFRGRDVLLPQVLNYYRGLRDKAGSSKLKLNLLQKQIDTIERWQNQYPDRVRLPD